MRDNDGDKCHSHHYNACTSMTTMSAMATTAAHMYDDDDDQCHGHHHSMHDNDNEFCGHHHSTHAYAMTTTRQLCVVPQAIWLVWSPSCITIRYVWWFPLLSVCSDVFHPFTVLFVFMSTLGMLECLLDASAWLSTPSILPTMPRFIPPALRCVLVPSPWSITAVSALFAMLGASVCIINPSWLLDPSAWSQMPSMSPACNLVPSRHTRTPVSLLSTYVLIITVTSASDLFGTSATQPVAACLINARMHPCMGSASDS